MFGLLVFGASDGFVYWALLHVSLSMVAVTFATIWTASATSYATVLMPLVTVAAASWLAGDEVEGRGRPG